MLTIDEKSLIRELLIYALGTRESDERMNTRIASTILNKLTQENEVFSDNEYRFISAVLSPYSVWLRATRADLLINIRSDRPSYTDTIISTILSRYSEQVKKQCLEKFK